MTDRVREALEPCPFCGKDAGFEQIGGPGERVTWSVGCQSIEDDCIGFQMLAHFSRKQEAADAWNKRAALASEPRVSEDGRVLDVERAVAAERERCAKLAEGFSAHQVCGGWGARSDTDKNYAELAKAIRALSRQQPAAEAGASTPGQASLKAMRDERSGTSDPASAEDRRIMGTREAADVALIAKLREWRKLRQPSIGTAKSHRDQERREHQLRFEICNTGLHWLWHVENPNPAPSPVAHGNQGEHVEMPGIADDDARVAEHYGIDLKTGSSPAEQK